MQVDNVRRNKVDIVKIKEKQVIIVKILKQGKQMDGITLEEEKTKQSWYHQNYKAER